MITFAGGTINNEFIQRWMKIDTMGVCNYYKEYSESWMTSTQHTVKTYDKKFISIARFNSIYTYLYKLNSSLEYDSVYTRPFTYDSLCPGGVVSDTINPDCDLIVHIEDPERETGSCQMKVFPNPAMGRVTVVFPMCLKQTMKQPGISSTSVTYQWRSTLLEAFDLNGRRVFSQQIPKSQQTFEINVSDWSRGMYYFRIVYNKNKVADTKVLLQ